MLKNNLKKNLKTIFNFFNITVLWSTTIPPSEIHHFQNTPFFLVWEDKFKMKTSHECSCAPDVKTGIESKSKHTRCTCHLSFPERVVWCSEVHNAPCSTASFCMAWMTLKDYIYPLTISQIKWFEMKLPNLTKKNHCAASNLHPISCSLSMRPQMHLHCDDETPTMHRQYKS